MTYGRSLLKAMDKFQIDTERWHELAADRGAWRETLRTGLAPPSFRPQASEGAFAAHRTHQADARMHAGHHCGD